MTRFRGCIDIHSGQVKQIVGGTLTQDDTSASSDTTTNFVSTKPSSYYAQLYKDHQIHGCHVIKLGSNPANDEAAKLACATWPGHLQVGGGINSSNALEWLDKYHAGQVIVTSWLFEEKDGTHYLDFDKLAEISRITGPGRLVVDLSCRRTSQGWVVAINKWQTLTTNVLGPEFLQKVAQYCSELLVHAADVEGLCGGIDEELVSKLGEWCPDGFSGKIVYAGGAKSLSDLDLVERLSGGKVDLTYGSALDIFGGSLVRFEDVLHRT